MRKKCNTIGILPSSYNDSLSYAEGIQYLTGQIKNVLIPAVNNNGEIVQDIKEYYETHPIPTKVSQLQNDEGYITNEVDPTVPSYVKAITEEDIRRWNQGGGSGGDTLPIATIVPYSNDTAPNGWLICDGSEVSRTTYKQLFDIIGVTYGSGDGSTTFNIPNFKGKVLVGKDGSQTEFDTLGETGGEKTHTLTIEEMPNHNHSLNVAANNNSGTLGSGYGIELDTRGLRYALRGLDNPVAGELTGFGINFSGLSQAHNNLQPYTVVNYIIKYEQTTKLDGIVVDEYSESTEDAYCCDYVNTNIDIINTDINNIESDIDDINTIINDMKITTLNNENRYGVRPNGANLLISIPIFNPSGNDPILRLSSAKYFTGSQWLDLNNPTIIYSDYNEIIISSSTPDVPLGVSLVRLIGNITSE